MPLRIAHFVQRYPPALGGSEAYFARLSRFCAAQGDHVTVFTTTGEALDSFWSPGGSCLKRGSEDMNGVRVERHELAFRFRGRRWLLKPLSFVPHRRWQCLTAPCNPLSWDLWRAISQVTQHFDVIHATAFPYAFPILCGKRLARRLDVPFLLTPFLHLGDPQNPHDPTRRVYTAPHLMALAKAANFVFVQTASEKNALLEHGIEEDRIILQGLGVDVSECTAGDRRRARQAWGVSQEEVVIGHLANNSAAKGTIDLVKAAKLLHCHGVPFRLVLAGPQMPDFLKYWQTQKHPYQVWRLGKLTDQQKRDFYAGIDLFALPSLTDSFGLVLLEAWANGVPNVAYRAGGIADLIRTGQDGLLTPAGNIDALAAALRQVIIDATLRQRLGAAGQKRVSIEFRWEDKLALVRETYLRATNRGRKSEVRDQKSKPVDFEPLKAWLEAQTL